MTGSPLDSLISLGRDSSALERARSLGFPHRGQEAWRVTSLESLSTQKGFRRARPPANLPDLSAWSIADADELVLINGELRPELCRASPELLACIVAKAAPAVEEGGFFAQLNQAAATSSLVIEIPKKWHSAKALHIFNLSLDAGVDDLVPVSLPRLHLSLGRDASLEVLESHFSPAGFVSLSAPLTTIELAEGSSLTHVRLQNESEDAWHLATCRTTIAAAANCRSLAFSAGARVSRLDLNAVLQGEGGNAELDGLYAVHGRQLADFHTALTHQAPHCTSRQIVKGILDDRSRGVFEGLIRIAKDAQKSDSSQLSRSLLLSSGARVDTKPELDVLADDVKAAHGAAIGQLDPEQMFYLRSRGIPAETARRLLIHGFMEEIVSKVPAAMHDLIAAAFVRFET